MKLIGALSSVRPVRFRLPGDSGRRGPSQKRKAGTEVPASLPGINNMRGKNGYFGTRFRDSPDLNRDDYHLLFGNSIEH